MAVNNPYALGFDGVDDYIIVGKPLIKDKNAFTIEGKIKITENEKTRRVFVSCGKAKMNNELIIYVNSIESDGCLRLFFRDASEYVVILNEYDIRGTGYRYLTFSRNDTLFKLYLDSQKIWEEDLGDINFGDYFWLGAAPGDNSNDRFHLLGNLDEIRVWDYERSQAEIQYYMNKQLTGNELGLAAYYRCDNDNADNSILQDYTGNGNDGNIHGAVYVPGEVDLAEPDPVIITGETTNISDDTATLNGEIISIANYSSLDVAFQYSPYPDFSQNIGQTPIQTITSPQLISANISGLDNSLGYYTRIMAQESS